ncbi:carboxypeptidase-like regulatory domain-containing protein [Chryseobacterium sp. MFBS3-17]|uniref:carboxypeptidase-like regulatory domain-containing protein n=1 Tax=Chryseobacterium sp. MFBS3-17 TaxID=2886689 RepID=UPI001D0EECBD|nr:carboxypeptidase-like regulatory domain-containing protein [Chryseobacterium sp. MFBS3-17]MCC2591015.1 carboxypeptidase-like regulatory domain-containing protein [Chryseobacterium sp. MFBS3-17]
MRTSFILLLCLFFTVYSQAQTASGTVHSEFGNVMPGVMVINMKTLEKVLTNSAGNFSIPAAPSDELRFLREGYDRQSVIVSDANASSIEIIMNKTPYLIPEVEIAFTPTGILEKDVKALAQPQKTEDLNKDMRIYARTSPTTMAPSLRTPSAFALPDFSAGQVDVIKLGMAAAGLIAKATKKPLTTANYAETQEFYRRIKSTMDLSFYTSQGWDEEEIDRFLVYADQTRQLARRFRREFDAGQISSEMKMAYIEYIKTHKIKS